MKIRSLPVCLLLAAGGLAVADGPHVLQTRLQGYQEVPAVSTTGSGELRLRVHPGSQMIEYELTYSGLQGNVLQSHIHFAQRGVNGGIAVFLCTNLGNGPAGTQACPQEGTITGTITPASVVAGAAAQGIAAGEFEELLEALRSGVTYVNVHSSLWPGGEIRGQIGTGRNGMHMHHH